MNKIFQTAKENIKKSSMNGKTTAVLMVFLLILKQFAVFCSYWAEIQWQTRLQNVLTYAKLFWNDLIIFGIIIILIFINISTKNKLIKIILNTLNILIASLFLIDIITIYYFQSRLSIFELYDFFSISNANSFLQYLMVIILIIIAIVWISFIISQKYLHRIHEKNKQFKVAIGFFSISAIISFASFYAISNNNIQENIFSINIEDIKWLFSKTNIQENMSGKNYDDYFKYVKWEKKKNNVIIVFAESFSTVDSARDWGLYNNYPYFDKVQQQWITFKNFMAEWCTSETAHISLLQWVEPRENPIEKKEAAYYNFQSKTDPLPIFFNQLWYQTTFLSTVTLDFLNQRNFIEKMWFQNIIDEKYFKKNSKYVFDAAPDHVLYEAAEKVIENSQNSKEPLFLVMQTISNHRPYDTPLWTTKEEMFKYVDRNIYAFYQKLKADWYFDNWILIIVWDHRKMEAVGWLEFKKFWLTAHSRAVLTIIGTWIKPYQFNDWYIQHTDIFYSLKEQFATGKTLVQKDYNNVFIQNQRYQEKQYRPRAVRYCRFSEKNYVVLNKNGDDYTLTSENPYIRNYINAFKAYQFKWLVMNWSTNNLIANTQNNNSTILIAHRWSPFQTTDNSIKWFTIAKQNWADWVEFDVSFTKDDTPIIMHWPSLVTTRCWSWKNVWDYTLAELQKRCKLKNGETIQTLKSFLTKTKDRFKYFFLDIKIYDTTKTEKEALTIVNLIKELDVQDKVIVSSYDRNANYIIWWYEWVTAARDSFSTGDSLILNNFPHKYFMTERLGISSWLVQNVRDHNKEMVGYVINTTWELQNMIDMWVKIIMTDNIPLLKSYLKQKNQ